MSVSLRWSRPRQIGEYLANAINRDPAWRALWPPRSRGVYLVSRDAWRSQEPPATCGALYVGGNTGKAERFCTRIGDLIADMHGFFHVTGHHSGGIKLWRWCSRYDVPPGDLYFAWATAAPGWRWCGRCAEGHLHEQFTRRSRRADGVRLLNEIAPPACRDPLCAR